MNKRSASKIKIAGFDDLFGQGMEYEDRVIEAPIRELHTFKNHPFHIVDNFDMEQMVESIKEYGVLVPGIVRRREEGGYEIVSGHRRKYACEIIGRDTMPVVVKDLSDDEATITMFDANIQREHLLFSEKAFAYKLKFDAIKHQGSKGDKVTTDKIGEASKESGRQVQRYIRLTELITPLLKMVDERKVAFIPAVEMSYLSHIEQEWVYKKLLETKRYPTISQAAKIKHLSNSGELTEKLVDIILINDKKEQRKLIIPPEKINSYFPRSYTMDDIGDIIIKLLENWKKTQEEDSRDGTKGII
jgi:ParB family chromosome partitioning protein